MVYVSFYNRIFFPLTCFIRRLVWTFFKVFWRRLPVYENYFILCAISVKLHQECGFLCEKFTSQCFQNLEREKLFLTSPNPFLNRLFSSIFIILSIYFVKNLVGSNILRRIHDFVRSRPNIWFRTDPDRQPEVISKFVCPLIKHIGTYVYYK